MRAPALLLAVALAALLLGSVPAAGQFPTTMNYQVMLTNDSDEPLADQAVELVFRLFEAESGGVAVWTETHSTSTNGIGVVSVLLGSTSPLPYESIPGLPWLEVEVDGEIMSPRREIAAASHAFEAFDSRRLAGMAASDFATDAELATPGTINNGGNPVDWTKLKSVPAGFADGTDDVGGAGDGHSLDAADGAPEDAVYVSNVAYVGVGTTDPKCELHVHEQYGLPALMLVTNSTTGSTSTDGFQIGIMSGGDGRLMNFEDRDIVFGANSRELMELDPDATLRLAQYSGDSGELQIFGDTATSHQHRLYTDAFGGQGSVHDEAGNIAVAFGADGNGTGGRLSVQKDDTFSWSEGIDLNGNWANSEEPALQIIGSSNAATFYMNQTGNSTVNLPTNAIYDYEMLDEPGVASSITATSVELSIGSNALRSRSITVPSGGYVLALASGQVSASHVLGSWTDIDIGVSDEPTNLPSTQGIALTLPTPIPTGSYNFPVASQGLFEVGSAGTYTFYYLAWKYTTTEVWIDDMSLTLVFLPTAYGTVSPAQPGRGVTDRAADTEAGAPLSQAEIAAERAEAEAFNLARIERELAEIQAQVEAMKEER